MVQDDAAHPAIKPKILITLRMKFLISFIALLSWIGYQTAPQISAQMTEKEKVRMKESSNFKDGRFVNLEKTPVMNPESSTGKIMHEFMRKGENREPKTTIETKVFKKEEFINQDQGISLVWFGHSSVIMNVDGKIILVDPVFSKRASPVSFTGTKKFDYSHDYNVDDLPLIDLVLISHDHYDHLDYKTIKQLKGKVSKFVVPLGVAGYLLKWGIPVDRIIELDWWESYTESNDLKITVTPARHFSGRTLKRNTTLWCSFAIEIKGKKIFFSGDSGYGKHFAGIGNKLGPFDIALMECGQYNKGWPLIHMDPSQTYQAFKDVKASGMIPLHWGKFKLSLHAWTEPVEKLLASCNGDTGLIITPQIGEIVNLNNERNNNYWWRAKNGKY